MPVTTPPEPPEPETQYDCPRCDFPWVAKVRPLLRGSFTATGKVRETGGASLVTCGRCGFHYLWTPTGEEKVRIRQGRLDEEQPAGEDPEVALKREAEFADRTRLVGVEPDTIKKWARR